MELGALVWFSTDNQADTLGPCSVKENPKTANDTKINPHAWNERVSCHLLGRLHQRNLTPQANVFFLDEPLNVGFSYAEHGQVRFPDDTHILTRSKSALPRRLRSTSKPSCLS